LAQIAFNLGDLEQARRLLAQVKRLDELAQSS
jgi:hypothetical protein